MLPELAERRPFHLITEEQRNRETLCWVRVREALGYKNQRRHNPVLPQRLSVVSVSLFPLWRKVFELAAPRYRVKRMELTTRWKTLS